MYIDIFYNEILETKSSPFLSQAHYGRRKREKEEIRGKKEEEIT